MKSSVIVFPGSNCDRDIAVALEKMQFKNQMVWHKETKLPKSSVSKPTSNNLLRYAILVSVGMNSFKPCIASRGHSINFSIK